MDLSKAKRTILLASVVLIAAARGGVARSASGIAVADRANANASLAAEGRFAAIAWGASTKDAVTDIYLATSRDGGRAFGAPTRVNFVAGEANLSGEQPPRVSLIPRNGRDPAIVVVWTAKSSLGTRLWSARSDDGGASFGSPTLVPGSDAPGNRGWESIATSDGRSVVGLWLDHRELSNPGAGAGSMSQANHQHGTVAARPTDGAARAQFSKVFFSRLDDATGTRALAGGVCYCCKTAIAAGSNGRIYAAWRHVYAGNVRDIAFAMSRDGGRAFSAPVRVSEDNWVLDGCPENGPALAVDDRQRIHVVWPTLVPGGTAGAETTLALFYATSSDGQHFTARQRVPTQGVPRHPQIAVGQHGEITVAWDEQAGGTRRVALARGTLDPGGVVQLVRQPIVDAAPAVYPVLGVVDDGMVVAWTSGPSGQTVIRTEHLGK
jgi:hypothetical protein